MRFWNFSLRNVGIHSWRPFIGLSLDVSILAEVTTYESRPHDYDDIQYLRCITHSEVVLELCQEIVLLGTFFNGFLNQ